MSQKTDSGHLHLVGPDEVAIDVEGQDLSVGTTVSKDYTVIKLLGKGGMGTVYLAENKSLKNRVAIKALPIAKGKDAVARFIAEAKTASQIESQYVVRIYDYFSDEAHCFIVMEYVTGRDLETIIETEGPFTLERLLPVVRQICRGLAAAHALGIVHRDLKAENIQIFVEDGDEYAKIMDFGIAKLLDAEMSQRLGRRALTQEMASKVMGTPFYMPPEQVTAKEIDVRADVYAVAVLVYRALTGRYPFEGDTLPELFGKITHEEPTPIAAYAPHLAVIWPVLAKALAKDRNDRYADAKAFADALEAAAGKPRVSRTSVVTAAAALGHAPTLMSASHKPARKPVHDPMAITQDVPVPGALPPTSDQAAAPAPRPERTGAWPFVVKAAVALLIGSGIAYAIAANRGAAPEQTAAPASAVHATQPATPSQAQPPAVPHVAERQAAAAAPANAADGMQQDRDSCSRNIVLRAGRESGWRAACVRYRNAACVGAAPPDFCAVIEATLRSGR